MILSDTFTSKAGLTKALAQVRGDVREAHGYARDDKSVRVAAGMFVMQMAHGENWLDFCDAQIDMRDRLAINGKGESKVQTFRIRVR
jgi:hypothetical protein